MASSRERTCGPCRVCCHVLHIEELAKPAGTLCRHAAGAGRGCAIYPTRPQTCIRWFCLWRKIDALPDRLRPDRSGILFSLEHRSPADGADEPCIVGRSVGRRQGVKRRDIAAAFAMFAREGALPVWRVSDRRAVRLHAATGL